MATALKQELETIFTANLNPLKAGFASASIGAKGFGSTASGAMSKFSSIAKTASSSILILGSALSTATGYATKMYSEFEKGMASVWTLTDWTKNEWQTTSKDVLGLAEKTGEELGVLTKGLYDTISAQPNIKREDSIKFLEQASKAGIAGASNTATAVDMLTSVVNSYDEMLGKGMSKTQKAAKASDVIFNTMKYGKTNFNEIAGSIGRVSAISALSGISLEELGAALATATLGGLKTDEAVTSLRQILVTALNPTKEAADEARKLGIAFDATAIKSMGLYNWLSSIDEATKNSKNSTESLTKLFGNVRAFSGAAIIVKMKNMYSQLNRSIKSETGSTEKAYGKMTDTFSFKWNTMIMKMKTTATEFGRGAVEALKPFFDSQQENINQTKNWFGAYEAGKTIISGLAASFYFLKAIILQIIGYAFDFENTWKKTLGWFELTATKGFEKIFGIMLDTIKGTPLENTSMGKGIFNTYWNLAEQSYSTQKAYKEQENRYNDGSKLLFSQSSDALNMAKLYGFQTLETMGLKDKDAKLNTLSTNEDIEKEVIKRLQGTTLGKYKSSVREYDFTNQPFFSKKPIEQKTGMGFSGGVVNTERQKQIDAVLIQVLKEIGKPQEFEQKKTNFLLERLLEKTSQQVQKTEAQPARQKKFFISVDGKVIADR